MTLRRCILVGSAASVAWMSAAALEARAQGPSLRLGAGGAMSGDYVAGWGGHGMAELSVNRSATFDARASASLAVGSFTGGVGSGVFGLDLLGIAAFGAGSRPYVGAGLGYSWTELSANRPLSHDLGVTTVVGFEWMRAGSTWFVEGRSRVFGNIFLGRSITRSVLLLSVGRSIR